MLLIVDNYDSFVHNIFHFVDYPASKIIIRRNDKFQLDDIERWCITHIIISPGPMTPKESGLSNDLILKYGKHIPILGICLGHQCIGHVFNSIVGKHPQPTHGQKSKVYLKESVIFQRLPRVVEAGRYHSLYISRENFNDQDLEVISYLEDGTIMGVQHRRYPIYGIQFHPESILTGENGKVILNNFMKTKCS